MSDTNSSSPEQLTDSAGTVEASLEVRPVEPIKLDVQTTSEEPKPGPRLTDIARPKKLTPEEQIASLRKDLETARTDASAAVRLAEHWKAQSDLAKKERESALDSFDSAKKHLGELADERQRWRAKAERLETQVDGQKAEKLVAMIDERQKLRTDCGHKDKQIADLTRKLEATEAQVYASRALARQAEQRFQGLEASVEAMQAARDKAQQERGGALEDLASEKRLHENAKAGALKLLSERDELYKRITELEAAAKQRPAASTPAALRQGA